MTTPDTTEPTASPAPEFERPRSILVPIDLSPAGEAKLPVAEEYARALDADLLLLHVLKPGSHDPSTVLPSEAVARTYLDTLMARLHAAGLRADAILRVGQPGPVIVQEAIIRDVRLIVIGTNLRPALPSAVMGSAADHVARNAPCPVMLVRPQGDLMSGRHLRCFQEDAERAGVLVQRRLGIRTIEVGRIIGSVDRCLELGMDFRPPPRRRRKHDEDRLRRVQDVMDTSASVPAIDVYKLGFGYYVLDGHHRVAVALANNQVEIEANVTEYVPVVDEVASERFAARRAFERATGLTEVGAARPGSYTTLLETIERYRDEQHLSEMTLAGQRWYHDVFRPLWQTIRARGLAAAFPGDRSADLIARVAAWRAAQRPDLDWQAAIEEFLKAHEVAGIVNVSSR